MGRTTWCWVILARIFTCDLIENPVKLWLNDFDKTGTLDHFLTRNVEGRDVPVFLKREITDQFPVLKKENLLHSEYARRMLGLFGEELMKSSGQKKV